MKKKWLQWYFIHSPPFKYLEQSQEVYVSPYKSKWNYFLDCCTGKATITKIAYHPDINWSLHLNWLNIPNWSNAKSNTYLLYVIVNTLTLTFNQRSFHTLPMHSQHSFMMLLIDDRVRCRRVCSSWLRLML